METTLIGTIIPFAGHYEFDHMTNESRIVEEEKLFLQGVKNATALAEKGWLLCNGKAIFMNDNQLSKLFEVIGFLWGEGDSPDTNVNPFPYFRIPDLCGLFLRGAYSSKTKRDPDVKTRGRIYHNDLYSPYVACPGSYQSDAFAQHNHICYFKSVGSAQYSNIVQPHYQLLDNVNNVTSTEGLSIETRPKNVYVNFLIKASDNPIDILRLYKENEILNEINAT